MTTSQPRENDCAAREAELLKELGHKLPFFRRALSTRFANDEVERIVQQLQAEFRAMLPRQATQRTAGNRSTRLNH